ncbi:hypothetical protein PghCCS26_47310 [Paenibacillus glycanilyticus]|uniref:Uncharacterized protein n=1 Tax=Paenibacillus glycanilyticus TaxID=126569 RepID=A0ABQ6NR63_9BACL|nr:hypothetical protein [Paenibacillus glycanilyticus]GMK47601.1 hypothetical protein PghCCS26_47310 [Paenibacillus glycanilyticus]
MRPTVIDPKGGTHFTSKIFVVPHALDRAVEYFRIERSAAPMYVMDMLRKASLIDPHVIGEDGNPGRLFAYKRTAFVVALTEDTVITLYPQETAAKHVIEGVGKVLQRALKAAQRTEARELKRLAIRRAELNVKRAELELRLLCTNSTSVIRRVNEEITKIDAELAAIVNEEFEIKREKSTIAKGICAFIQ